MLEDLQGTQVMWAVLEDALWRIKVCTMFQQVPLDGYNWKICQKAIVAQL